MFFKRYFSDSLIYSLGPQIPKIAGIFVLPIITRFLTPTDYGVYGLVTAYIGVLSALGDLGFSILMVNSFFNFPQKWQIHWRQIHFYLSIWGVVYGLLLGLLLYFILPEEVGVLRSEIILLNILPPMFFNVTTLLGTRYYQYARKPLYVSIVSAFVGCVSILLNLFFIAYLRLGFMGWFYTLFITSFLNFVAYLYPIYFIHKLTPIVRFKPRNLFGYLKVSLPLVPHNYSTYLLNTSDRVVMDHLKIPTEQIGKYNMAYTFGGYAEFFGNVLGMAIGPTYTKLFSKKEEQAERTVYFLTNWLQYSFICGSFILALWCKELLYLLVKNPELNQVYDISIIIIMGYCYRPYYWNAINKLQYTERSGTIWKVSFIAAVINVILNLIFIPMYGYFAAAITTFISLLYIGFSGYYLEEFKSINKQPFNPIGFIVLICAATALVYSLKDISLVAKWATTLLVLIVYFIYFRKVYSKLKNID